jgi:hydrogenase maturation protein HypF
VIGLTVQAQRIRVTGIVQGVGFRPFVWQLAQQIGLTGWVRNDSQGVELLAQGTPAQLHAIQRRLRDEAPPLARVDTVQIQIATALPMPDFSILASQSGQAGTAIGPDVAVCAECLTELFDPSSRRYRHPFITCTHCGPRFTVTRTLPYDRPQTSMAPFPLCARCAQEYTSPVDRRFHAETTCCPQCGPQLNLTDLHGKAIDGDPITQTLRLLQDGQIVAIKGLGGFHLTCDARNAQAVARLRKSKNREAKPFAVMLANIPSTAAFAQINDTERDLLQSRERPVALLNTHAGVDASLSGIAPGLWTLGVMLPTTPIHFLLFHEAACRPKGAAWLTKVQPLVLVMTSANPGGEPIVRDTLEARARLAGIADALLDHNRDIVARCDDSVVQVAGQVAQFIRRSRGYAPAAIQLPHTGPSVLAFGSHLKNTVCVTRGAEAFLSPHVGSLDNASTCCFQDETVQRLLDLLEVQPTIIAHDLHPDDYSTRAACDLAQQLGIATLAVQHHHAHIAAVCAEHDIHGPVVGLALDGVGLGNDHTAWGGELLRVDGARCERLGHLRPLPMPGGDKCAQEPWRMAAAVLHELGRNADITQRFADPATATVATMLQRQINCPRTSSMGRVFDAAAGLLGLSTHMQFEAQAPVLLEQAASIFIANHGWPLVRPDAWHINDDAQLDLLPLLATLGVANDVTAGAAQFHATLVDALTDWVTQSCAKGRLNTVVFGGGCFLNRLLTLHLRQNLENNGITVLTPQRTSPGDASISLGQAWVARHHLETNICV